MLDIANSKAVFLDHSYCKKAVFDVKFTQDSTTTKEQRMADNSLNWDEFGVEFQPPSPHSDIPLSALSPSHSIDSGFGNEMNLFAEFDGMDLDSVMESILNTDMNANIPNQKRQTQENSKQQAPSVKVASSRSKVKEDETDKNQKNAIAARENRLKKKKHLEGMDFNSVMESFLNTDINQKRQTQEISKQPSPVKVASRQPKVKEGMDETDKNQKNAIAARENRLKKKKHLEGMEKELEQLKQENAALKAKDRRYDQVVGKLRNEVSYLKNVIANESTLSDLVVTTPAYMGTAHSLAGITFTSSLLSQGKDERPTTEDKSDADDVMIDDEPNDAEPPSQTDNCKEKVGNLIQKRYQTRGTKRNASAAESSSTGRKKASNDEVNGGVCLHIGQGKVSLEFCSQCSMNANGNSQH